MEILEDHPVNSGRDPYKVLFKKQKIPLDKNESEDFKKENLRWLQPKDLRTGKDILIYGMKIYLYDCDMYTRKYYKTQLGVEDMYSIKIAEKPKTLPPKISPLPMDLLRRFVILFYPSNDSVSISEEPMPNSDFPGRLFYKKDKLIKKEVDASVQPIYYQADDFYVGAYIKAWQKVFELIHAEPYVLTFMNDHPELYSKKHIQLHEDRMSFVHNNEEFEKNCCQYPPRQAYKLNPRKAPPHKPNLKVSKNENNDIILTWNMQLSSENEQIGFYQIFTKKESYCVGETSFWRKIGDVTALPLPMLVVLSEFENKTTYHFMIRAVDMLKRFGPFSDPSSIFYEKE